MQELKVHRWCDVCFRDSKSYVEAEIDYTISISQYGRRPLIRKLELCGEHAKPVTELHGLLLAAGTQPNDSAHMQPASVEVHLPPANEKTAHPKGGTSGSRPVHCPICQLKLTRHAINGHLVVQHGAKRIKHPTKCPDCGDRLAEPNAMSTHRRKVHGFDTVAALVATVSKP